MAVTASADEMVGLDAALVAEVAAAGAALGAAVGIAATGAAKGAGDCAGVDAWVGKGELAGICCPVLGFCCPLSGSRSSMIDLSVAFALFLEIVSDTGHPQFTHTAALSEISFPHSQHLMRAMPFISLFDRRALAVEKIVPKPRPCSLVGRCFVFR